MLCYFLLTVCEYFWKDETNHQHSGNQGDVDRYDIDNLQRNKLNLDEDADKKIFDVADKNRKFSSRIICTRNLTKGFFRIFNNYRGILTGVMCNYHPLGHASLDNKK